MKKLIYLLLAMPLLFASCNKDADVAGEETVQVTFCAELPQLITTRATTLNVDKVACAVFENNTEIIGLRTYIDISAGQSILFSPRLIKGRSYKVVFWAYKYGCYDVDDMTAITRNSGWSEADYDAFTATIATNGVTGVEQPIGVTLQRPFAQLNVGITQEDWDAVTNIFHMTPTTTTISLTGKSTFNALSGAAVGTDSQITYTLPEVSGADLVVISTTYKNIATCFVLPEDGQENFNITYSVSDQNGSVIRTNTIDSVPFEANHKTNLVGSLLTGIVTYNVEITGAFDDSEHNEEI